MPDVKRLIAEVASQNGIRLEPDDPAFALVTLNQLVLEETANRLCERTLAALAQFTESLNKAEQLAGRTLAKEVRAAGVEIRDDWAANLKHIQPPSTFSETKMRQVMYGCVAAGAVLGSVLLFTGFALGRMFAG